MLWEKKRRFFSSRLQKKPRRPFQIFFINVIRHNLFSFIFGFFISHALCLLQICCTALLITQTESVYINTCMYLQSNKNSILFLCPVIYLFMFSFLFSCSFLAASFKQTDSAEYRVIDLHTDCVMLICFWSRLTDSIKSDRLVKYRESQWRQTYALYHLYVTCRSHLPNPPRP